jgi:hypothetical protein
MRRRIVIALLALGTIGGYAAGFAHMHRACHSENGHAYWHGNNASHDCDQSKDLRSDSR